MPNLVVIRPAPNETPYAWKAAIENKSGPSAIILSRQKIPIIDNTKFRFHGHVENGAYIVLDSKQLPELILIGSGSELHLVYKAGEKLTSEGYHVRVVSMPSWELFEKQNIKYKESVLPSEVKNRIAVEAASSFGWERYIGTNGVMIGVDRFGASAPGEKVLEKFGYTVENIITIAKEILHK
jgi:transketolase